MVEREQYITYLQKYNWDCGAGAAGIVLLNFGQAKINHNNLLNNLEVNRRRGTPPRNLELFFRRRGFDEFVKENSTISDLRREIKKGRLPIVMFQGSGTEEEMANYEGGHYAVVAAVGTKYIYLLDPGVDVDYGDGVGWYKLSHSTFDRRWRDKEVGKEIYYIRWMLSVGLKK